LIERSGLPPFANGAKDGAQLAQISWLLRAPLPKKAAPGFAHFEAWETTNANTRDGVNPFGYDALNRLNGGLAVIFQHVVPSK
jgi:hypothetical protein